MVDNQPAVSEYKLTLRQVAGAAALLIVISATVGAGIAHLRSVRKYEPQVAQCEERTFAECVDSLHGVCSDLDGEVSDLEREVKEMEFLVKCQDKQTYGKVVSAGLIADLRYAIHEGARNPQLLARYDNWLNNGGKGISPGQRRQYFPTNEASSSLAGAGYNGHNSMGGENSSETVESIFRDAVLISSCPEMDRALAFYAQLHPKEVERSRLRVNNPNSQQNGSWLGEALWFKMVGRRHSPPAGLGDLAQECYFAVQPHHPYATFKIK